MKAIVLKVDPPKQSRHGGVFQRSVFKDLDTGKEYIFDCYHNHSQSKRFLPYLKPQAIFDNLNIVRDKFINGCCDFIYLGQRHG